MTGTINDLRRKLRSLSSPAKSAGLRRFFKTGPGEYGEGDHFRGLTVPVLRQLARAYSHLPLRDVAALLDSKWHEDRLLALLLLVRKHLTANAAERDRIYRFYLRKLQRVNNWDLVDSSAEYIVGPHMREKGLDVLLRLAQDKNLWKRRVAVLSTFHFIKQGEFRLALRICALLRHDEHDLIHKAVGWMLREIGKRDAAAERKFLDRYAAVMPRTMLRYAIEKFPERERKRYLARGPMIR